MKPIVKLLRPKQWVKNFACFAGLIFSGRLFQPDMQLRAFIGFAAFCLAASAVYIFNDYIDREKDRLNPRTAKRPLAAGSISVSAAFLLLALTLAGSFALAFSLNLTCLGLTITYLVLNLFYSLRLKRTVIADVICIALGFVLRVLLGVYAVEVKPSPWIVMCIFYLALFLGFGKRRGEMTEQKDTAADSRPVLSKYTIHYLDMAFGICASLTLITYSLYCVLQHHDLGMVITILPVAYCILRYAHQVVVSGRGQSPEKLLFRDRLLWIGIAVWVLLTIFALYGHSYLDKVFAP